MLASKYLTKFSLTATIRRNASTVGFIGLGNMGAGMAANLVTKGETVVVFDVVPEPVTALEKLGAIKAASPAEVGRLSDKIITMLPSNAHVEDVLTGNEGVFNGAKSGALLIDSSTVDPELSVRMGKLAMEKGINFVDAPVSGGVDAAKTGSLTFMVGGDKADMMSAEEVLLKMGKTVIHCGPIGCGGAAKICNNMMLAISMIGHSETMNLGIKLGLDPKVLNSILNSSSGKTWVSDVYSPVPNVMPERPSSKGYQGGFRSALMLKDLSLAQTAATQTQAPTPLGALAQQFYRMACAQGHSEKDFGYVFQMISAGSKQ
ncbi:3-hydroxyisobutyrate dehydrogenase, mitochondrial [Galendromus occidentalis]|uniref:3-hydroxyisobutyrate dehydrogenase n=1 Tax=Galendromus occidentalis TaxID=34638 RepID=A0AAJ6QPW3_9ACAR|nr:3-hydroxyisobutyrate dehydrogenase, mitochondrial [Galendromus occidentalis]